MLRSRRPWPPRRREKPWLYTIALNCLRDSARRERTEARALERVAAQHGADGQEAELAGVEGFDTVRSALELLADDEREAIALRFGADLSVPEIARTLGIPLTTAEGRVYRALRKLRGALS